MKTLLGYLGHDADYLDRCDESWYGDLRDLSITYGLLKQTWQKRDFSKEELVFYDRIMKTARAFTESVGFQCENLQYITGFDDDNFRFPSGTKFQPEQVKVHSRHASDERKPVKTPVDPIGVSVTPDSEDKQKYIDEISRLRTKLHKTEQSAQQLRDSLNESKRKISDMEAIKNSYHENLRELTALREHLYNFTQYDIADDELHTEEMKAVLEKKQIVIIGGHPNWLSKLKLEFPGWRYINEDMAGSAESRTFIHADRVYFFTDVISHSTYYRFVHVLRANNIPFGYIHGVNISANIRQIYDDVCRKGK